MGLSNEIVICILVAHGATKLLEVKVEDTRKNLRLEPGPHLSCADRAERQNFFQTSNFDI